MSQASLRVNPEHTAFEATTPEGEEFICEWPDDALSLLEGEQGNYLAVLDYEESAGEDSIKAYKLYRLELVDTVATTEEVGDPDDDDEEDEEPEAEEPPMVKPGA